MVTSLYYCGALFFGCLCVDALLVLSIDGTENHQRKLQELKVAAQTVVESIDSAEESSGSLADRLRWFLISLPSTWLKLLGIV